MVGHFPVRQIFDECISFPVTSSNECKKDVKANHHNYSFSTYYLAKFSRDDYCAEPGGL